MGTQAHPDTVHTSQHVPAHLCLATEVLIQGPHPGNPLLLLLLPLLLLLCCQGRLQQQLPHVTKSLLNAPVNVLQSCQGQVNCRSNGFWPYKQSAAHALGVGQTQECAQQVLCQKQQFPVRFGAIDPAAAAVTATAAGEDDLMGASGAAQGSSTRHAGCHGGSWQQCCNTVGCSSLQLCHDCVHSSKEHLRQPRLMKLLLELVCKLLLLLHLGCSSLWRACTLQ